EEALLKARSKEIDDAFERALIDAGVDAKVLKRARDEVEIHSAKITQIEENESLILEYSHWLTNVLPSLEQLQNQFSDGEKKVVAIRRKLEETVDSYNKKITELRDQLTKLKNEHLNLRDAKELAEKTIKRASELIFVSAVENVESY